MLMVSLRAWVLEEGLHRWLGLSVCEALFRVIHHVNKMLPFLKSLSVPLHLRRCLKWSSSFPLCVAPERCAGVCFQVTSSSSWDLSLVTYLPSFITSHLGLCLVSWGSWFFFSMHAFQVGEQTFLLIMLLIEIQVCPYVWNKFTSASFGHWCFDARFSDFDKFV